VTQRLSQYQSKYAPYITDSAKNQVQAKSSLSQITTREAQVRAYNDVIYLNGIFAVILLVWGFSNIASTHYNARRQPQSS
jgi:hypothetical protein